LLIGIDALRWTPNQGRNLLRKIVRAGGPLQYRMCDKASFKTTRGTYGLRTSELKANDPAAAQGTVLEPPCIKDIAA
jgi:hypothetical protein